MTDSAFDHSDTLPQLVDVLFDRGNVDLHLFNPGGEGGLTTQGDPEV